MFIPSYGTIRPAIRTGDIIFFDGKGPISAAVRVLAGFPSHAAIVERGTTSGEDRVSLVESTSQWVGKKWKVGVQRTYLSDRIKNYGGYIWWAPLEEHLSYRIVDHEAAFQTYLSLFEGVRYDFWQVARKGWRLLSLPSVFPITESYRRLFCSELVAFALKEMGVLPDTINASTISPRELAQFKIYASCNQLAGPKDKEIPYYNTVIPKGGNNVQGYYA